MYHRKNQFKKHLHLASGLSPALFRSVNNTQLKTQTKDTSVCNSTQSKT